MIYLIGGPPRVGKSTLARALAREKSIPYVSADDIASVITPYIPEPDYPTKLPLRFFRKETNNSNDIFYTQYSAQQIVGFYLRQAETLWPGFEGFIKYVLEDNHDFILEGWQILPHLVQAVASPENEGQMKMCFLYKNALNDILAGMKSNVAKNDWVIKNTNEEATFLSIAEMMKHFGDHISDEANKYGLNSVNMDFDFKQKIKMLSKSL